MRFLGAQGAKVKTPADDGRTPLCVAAMNGHLEVVRFLVAQGAKVDAPNKDGYTPLSVAAQNSHLEVVRFLKAQGAKVDAPANDGYTPLSVAAQNGYIEVVRFLEAQGGKLHRAVLLQPLTGAAEASCTRSSLFARAIKFAVPPPSYRTCEPCLTRTVRVLVAWCLVRRRRCRAAKGGPRSPRPLR